MDARPATNEGGRFSILMLGYTGCHNTGSDARILTIIEDIRQCFGERASITVASFYPERTARVVPDEARVRIERVPFVFPLKILRLAARHDVTFLVEGSCFKQNWASALLYLFLWGALCAKLAGRRCVAYAVDAGDLSPLNGFLTKLVCDRLDLIITRTEAARRRLRDIGVTARILANTDTAFQFLRHPSGLDAPPRPVPQVEPDAVGIAPVEFHHWPLKTKLSGKREECFNWPYYFTWDDERREKSRRLIESYRRLVVHAIERHDLQVVLLAMEALDAKICGQILAGLSERHKARVKFVSAEEYTPYQIAPVLRGLKYLVTSRYHACVLSMCRPVPQMALCHDERLESIYAEIGIAQDFLLGHDDPLLGEKIIPTFDRLVADRARLADTLREKYETFFLPRCRRNALDLRDWYQSLPPPRAGNAF
jgi:polysaccharide pyruvyl transferase WcaK-like protein